MHVNRADLVLHQVISNPHVIEVRRDEHRRVGLLSSQQLRQHRAHEVLESCVILGGGAVARDALENLAVWVYHRERGGEARRWFVRMFAEENGERD